MLKKLLNILSYQSKVVVIQKNLHNNTYGYLILKYKNQNIQIVKENNSKLNFDELLKEIPKNYPLILGLMGKGILNKKVLFKPNYRNTLLLNVDENDFYFNDTEINKHVFSSIIRKDILDNETNLFKSKNLFITSCYFGPFLLSSNLVFRDTPDSISIDGIQYKFSNGLLFDFEKTPSKDSSFASLEGFELKSSNLIKFIAGKLYLKSNLPIIENCNLYQKEQKQKVLFNRAGVGLLIFFLISLGFNYFYLNHLNNIIIDKNGNLTLYEENISELNKLKTERNRKQKLLNNSGILNTNFISYYLDEIGSSIPRSISLDNLSIYPVSNAIKKNKQIAIDDSQILINGVTESSIPFNEWVQEISSKDWIKKVEIQNYERKRKNNYEFEISLKLK